MQREGREGFAEGCTPMNISDPPSDHEWINTFIDQHTAATWKAALNSLLESGLLEEKEYSDEGDQQAMKYRNHNELGHNTLARDIKEFISNMDKV